MKKITFILFALIAGTAFGQDASGTATVNAHIVEIITIEGINDLNFGNMVASTGGKVRVHTDNNRTFSNPDMKVANTGVVGAASFNIKAADNFSYSISIPSIQLLPAVDGAPGTPMDISFFWDMNGTTDGSIMGNGEDQVLYVGGLLDVASGQDAGDYNGTVTVTVAYE
jgi:spore coat protein U-like protein